MNVASQLILGALVCMLTIVILLRLVGSVFIDEDEPDEIDKADPPKATAYRIATVHCDSLEPHRWIAPDGCTWVCGACGKYGSQRDRIGDESCFLNAVLCDTSSLVIIDGVVREAMATLRYI